MDKKSIKLTKEQMEQILGGFQQTIEGASYGEEIVCPGCGNSDASKFYCDGDILAEVDKDLYECAVCGKKFAVASGYGVTDILN
ncbi:MAG: hypothetical protein K6F99_10725 [Lachnospiraceae bacterium]|nr:hypothetical protein [Lachnospiraceae bacterium]